MGVPIAGQQLSALQAAQLGSQLTGLPLAFVQALIAEENTIANGHNNPFDVTQAFASYTPFPAIVGGGWGTQSRGNPYNPAAIASFPDIQTGVEAWADGINNQPIYALVRQTIASGTTDASTLAASFPAGYSGNSPTWFQNIVKLTDQFAGGTAPVAVNPAPAPATKPQIPIPGTTITTPDQILPTVGGAAGDLVNPIINALGTLVASIERFFWIVIGLILVGLGLWILLRGTPQARQAS